MLVCSRSSCQMKCSCISVFHENICIDSRQIYRQSAGHVYTTTQSAGSLVSVALTAAEAVLPAFIEQGSICAIAKRPRVSSRNAGENAG